MRDFGPHNLLDLHDALAGDLEIVRSLKKGYSRNPEECATPLGRACANIAAAYRAVNLSGLPHAARSYSVDALRAADELPDGPIRDAIIEHANSFRLVVLR